MERESEFESGPLRIEADSMGSLLVSLHEGFASGGQGESLFQFGLGWPCAAMTHHLKFLSTLAHCCYH